MLEQAHKQHRTHERKRFLSFPKVTNPETNIRSAEGLARHRLCYIIRVSTSEVPSRPPKRLQPSPRCPPLLPPIYATTQ